MNNHTSLTTEHLAEIEARTRAATPGPWVRYAEYGPTFYANTSGEYLRGVGDFNFGVGYQADADEAFVRHAPEDVRLLLAEVARLKGQRKCLLAQLAKRDAATGRGDAALREFLGGQPADSDGACGDPNDGDWCELEPGHDGHPRTVHREGDDPVTPGECSACPDDDARHDYRPAVGEQPETQETPNPRTVCTCGHTRGEHVTVSGRLLCDACDPDSTNNLVCKEFEAL